MKMNMSDVLTPGRSSTWNVTGKWEEISLDPGFKESIDRLERNMEKIMERLAILEEPDPKQLEQFKTLKEAYDKYKFVEGLCGKDDSVEINNT